MSDFSEVGLLEIEDRVVMSQWDEALDLALSAWRETRAPAYANLVEAISAKIASFNRSAPSSCRRFRMKKR